MVTVLGALAMVAGAVTIVMSLLLAFLTAMVPTAGAITPGGPVVIQSGVVLFSGVMGGIFQLGMGQLLFCIRDIAMNTYAMRRGI
jgi:hypothetical protein